MDTLVSIGVLLGVCWCAGIMLWSRSLELRYRRLQTAYNVARRTNDIPTAVVLSQAMREIRMAMYWRPRVLNPLHWARTLLCDYTARAAWELDDCRF